MKAFKTILLVFFAVFGFVLGVKFESAVPLAKNDLILLRKKSDLEAVEKEIIYASRNYLLPIEKMREPALKSGKAHIDIVAKVALAIDEESGKVLYEKNSEEKTAVASLAKLVTALTVLEFAAGNIDGGKEGVGKYDLSKAVKVGKIAVEEEGDSGSLVVGEKIRAGDLLAIMLVASSNDAAVALAEDVARAAGYEGGVESFVRAMNEVAAAEGLSGTHFSNPTGIDQEDNYSTAKDIVKAARIFLRRYPDFFRITKTEKTSIKSEDGKYSHYLKNTNELLGRMAGIEGGKTGYTDEAGESLLVAVKNSGGKHKIIAVVIGADNRFIEMKRLVDWVWDSYEWK